MSGTIAATAWWIIYLDEKPCILSAGPDGERVLEGVRSAMLGHIPEGMTLGIKSIFDAPTDDVVRVSAIALMTTLSGLAEALLAPRNVLRH